eukprot:TRINITY_DN11044_c0_g1_i1.p1 TRINITY_DN11044_c0_g1~~TRINITY_DN11044_c0_g1_i1.p1  ORF type:complete len:427 (+),score=142.75 TRINITY_DN11044_c0_g1_i1:78-1358(+)
MSALTRALVLAAAAAVVRSEDGTCAAEGACGEQQPQYTEVPELEAFADWLYNTPGVKAVVNPKVGVYRDAEGRVSVRTRPGQRLPVGDYVIEVPFARCMRDPKLVTGGDGEDRFYPTTHTVVQSIKAVHHALTKERAAWQPAIDILPEKPWDFLDLTNDELLCFHDIEAVTRSGGQDLVHKNRLALQAAVRKYRIPMKDARRARAYSARGHGGVLIPGTALFTTSLRPNAKVFKVLKGYQVRAIWKDGGGKEIPPDTEITLNLGWFAPDKHALLFGENVTGYPIPLAYAVPDAALPAGSDLQCAGEDGAYLTPAGRFTDATMVCMYAKSRFEYDAEKMAEFALMNDRDRKAQVGRAGKQVLEELLRHFKRGAETLAAPCADSLATSEHGAFVLATRKYIADVYEKAAANTADVLEKFMAGPDAKKA